VKPEDLLKPESFPDDLQWIVAEYRLNPRDPVFLLLAWHWNRMKACEDTVRLAVTEFKAAVDSRVELLGDAVETVAGVNEALAEVHQALGDRPTQLKAELEAQLKQPVADAVSRLKELEHSLGPIARDFQVAKRRQLLAALLVGVALGVLSAVIVFCA
jgi:hypothetical protein